MSWHDWYGGSGGNKGGLLAYTNDLWNGVLGFAPGRQTVWVRRRKKPDSHYIHQGLHGAKAIAEVALELPLLKRHLRLFCDLVSVSCRFVLDDRKAAILTRRIARVHKSDAAWRSSFRVPLYAADLVGRCLFRLESKDFQAKFNELHSRLPREADGAYGEEYFANLYYSLIMGHNGAFAARQEIGGEAAELMENEFYQCIQKY